LSSSRTIGILRESVCVPEKYFFTEKSHFRPEKSAFQHDKPTFQRERYIFCVHTFYKESTSYKITVRT
jgi:hypothetical protein